MLDFKTFDNWATNRPVEKRLPHFTTTESWLTEFQRDPTFWQLTLGTSSGTVFGTATGWRYWSWYDDEFEHDPATFQSELRGPARQFEVKPSAGRTTAPAGYEQTVIYFKPTLKPTCSRDEALHAPLIAVFPTDSIERVIEHFWIEQQEW